MLCMSLAYIDTVIIIILCSAFFTVTAARLSVSIDRFNDVSVIVVNSE